MLRLKPYNGPHSSFRFEPRCDKLVFFVGSERNRCREDVAGWTPASKSLDRSRAYRTNATIATAHRSGSGKSEALFGACLRLRADEGELGSDSTCLAHVTGKVLRSPGTKFHFSVTALDASRPSSAPFPWQSAECAKWNSLTGHSGAT
jgi:hypothetical protein